MDKIKIGQFISKCRKNKKLTQEQLAEKLNISKNAVSKWERGICLMDMSLLQPLSKILGVSVNEILSGQKLSDKQIIENANKNIIELNELYKCKGLKSGIIAEIIIMIIPVVYCVFIKIDVFGFASSLFGFASFIWRMKYGMTKDKYYLYISNINLVVAVICLLDFIIKTI